MKNILDRIKEVLNLNSVQISIKKTPNSNKIEMITVEHLPAGTSEHTIVRERKNCTINSTYRHGRKTGMQIHSREEFYYPGDLADHPLKRPSAPLDSPHDTAF